MIKSLGLISNPTDIIANLRQQGGESCVSFQFSHAQYYFGGEEILIGVVCYASQDQLRLSISADYDSIQKAVEVTEVVDPIIRGDDGGLRERDSDLNKGNKHLSWNDKKIGNVSEESEGISGGTRLWDAYNSLVTAVGLADLDLLLPLRLDRVHISKPWGQEIWYTGIEERGVCSVQGIPLPWILEVAGPLITGTNSLTPILLKILDPLPQEVLGDLYFELHKEKREVYVVTHIDKEAWPDSIGKIQYGFSQEKLRSYQSEEQFKKAYLKSVDKYKEVRNEIDSSLDKVDNQLAEREITLRSAMNEFTSLQSLRVGDVIQVQPFTPHSLQHGVRVIEFQTPHYERFIISFAQKVLTQDHWDTEEALSCVKLHESNNTTATTDEFLIADFEEFTVKRLALEPGVLQTIEVNRYCLIIGVQGQTSVNGSPLFPEDGVYIPACIGLLKIRNPKTNLSVILIAQPTAMLSS